MDAQRGDRRGPERPTHADRSGHGRRRWLDPLGISPADADAALLLLEADGVVLRGRFTPGETELEWCDRTLLARIHRYTLNRLRAEIEPVSPADFMRFLFRWQHVETSSRLTGLDGLREVVAALDGYELAAGAWERAVLPARLDRYDPSMLDMICLAGEAGWGRLSPATVAGRPGAQPGAGDADRALPARACGRVADAAATAEEPPLGEAARRVSVGAPVAWSVVLRRSRPSLRARRRPGCGMRSARWSPAGSRRRTDSRDCVPSCGRRADARRSTIVAATSPAGGRPSRHATRRHARRGGRAPGVVAAPPLRGRVPTAAHARDERRDVARACARVPAPRGARRDPQRPVRDGHVGRAVRAAGRGRTAARGSAHPGRRRSGHHQRGRSAEPHGDCHRGRTDPDRRPQPDRLSRRRAARRRSKATSCGSLRRSTRRIAADVSRALKVRRVPAFASSSPAAS